MRAVREGGVGIHGAEGGGKSRAPGSIWCTSHYQDPPVRREIHTACLRRIRCRVHYCWLSNSGSLNRKKKISQKAKSLVNIDDKIRCDHF